MIIKLHNWIYFLTSIMFIIKGKSICCWFSVRAMFMRVCLWNSFEQFYYVSRLQPLRRYEIEHTVNIGRIIFYDRQEALYAGNFQNSTWKAPRALGKVLNEILLNFPHKFQFKLFMRSLRNPKHFQLLNAKGGSCVMFKLNFLRI